MNRALRYLCIILLSVNQLDAQPKITSFSPSSGPVGTTVTINGSGFGDTSYRNIVWFGAVRANVLSGSVSQLIVQVPPGLSCQPISVTTLPNQLVGFSAQPFGLTFANAGQLDTSSFKRTDFATTWQSMDVNTLDLDGDGRPEIITDENQGGLVYRNTAPVGGMSFSLASGLFGTLVNTLADIDGDGKPDAISATTSGIAVSLNASSIGSFSFATAQSFTASTTFPSHISAADLDGDGKPDLFITYNNNPGFISVLHNSSTPGTVSFDPEKTYSIGVGALSVAISDLDGDGKPDLIVPSSGDYFTSIFRNISSPGTITLDIRMDLPTYGAVGVAAGDLDGDGKPEFILTNFNSDNIMVYKNKCTPGNLLFDTISFVTGSNPKGVAIGDLDGDGRPDIAVSNQSIARTPDNSVTVFKNITANGIMKFGPRTDFKTTGEPAGIKIADLDQDGHYEIVVASASGSAISVLKYQPSVNPLPRILSFTPALAKAGDTVRISGINFIGTTAVSLGGVPVSTFLVSSPTLIVAVAGNGASGNVRITNAAGSDSVSGFTYNALPHILSFTPTTSSAGGLVTITGKNLFYTTDVSFGGLPALSFVVLSDSVVQAVVGYGSAGYIQLTTTTGVALVTGFNFYIQPAPIVQSFAPGVASPGTTVTIHGKNFTNAQAVYFGSLPPDSFTVLSDSVISANIGYVASGYVSVFTLTGSDSAAGFTFSYTPVGGVVQVSSFSPASAAQGSAVTITGHHFTNANAVSFGGVPADYFTVLSDSVIEAVVFTGATGYVKVTSMAYADSLSGFNFISGPNPGFVLTQFSGSSNGTDALIQWQSMNDAGIDHYVVDKSPDSTHFVPIGSVVSARSTGTSGYSYTDQSLRDTMNYYRLEIIDTLGNFSYSTIFLIIHQSASAAPLSIRIHPNPSTGFTMVDHPASASGGQITLLDMTGKVISKTGVDPNTTVTRVELPVKMLGVYKIVWTNGTKSRSQTILIQ